MDTPSKNSDIDDCGSLLSLIGSEDLAKDQGDKLWKRMWFFNQELSQLGEWAERVKNGGYPGGYSTSDPEQIFPRLKKLLSRKLSSDHISIAVNVYMVLISVHVDVNKADLSSLLKNLFRCYIINCQRGGEVRHMSSVMNDLVDILTFISNDQTFSNSCITVCGKTILRTIISREVLRENKFNLVTSLNDVLARCSREVCHNIPVTSEIEIYSLLELLITWGDYEAQTFILEIAARVNARKHSNKWNRIWSGLSPCLPELFQTLTAGEFETNVRTFLNKLNESLAVRGQREVFSIPAESCHNGQIELLKPPDNNIEAFWVDFCLGGPKIYMFYVLSEGDLSWSMINVLERDVSKLSLVNEGDGLKCLTIKFYKPCCDVFENHALDQGSKCLKIRFKREMDIESHLQLLFPKQYAKFLSGRSRSANISGLGLVQERSESARKRGIDLFLQSPPDQDGEEMADSGEIGITCAQQQQPSGQKTPPPKTSGTAKVVVDQFHGTNSSAKKSGGKSAKKSCKNSAYLPVVQVGKTHPPTSSDENSRSIVGNPGNVSTVKLSGRMIDITNYTPRELQLTISRHDEEGNKENSYPPATDANAILVEEERAMAKSHENTFGDDENSLTNVSPEEPETQNDFFKKIFHDKKGVDDVSSNKCVTCPGVSEVSSIPDEDKNAKEFRPVTNINVDGDGKIRRILTSDGISPSQNPPDPQQSDMCDKGDNILSKRLGNVESEPEKLADSAQAASPASPQKFVDLCANTEETDVEHLSPSPTTGFSLSNNSYTRKSLKTKSGGRMRAKRKKRRTGTDSKAKELRRSLFQAMSCSDNENTEAPEDGEQVDTEAAENKEDAEIQTTELDLTAKKGSCERKESVEEVEEDKISDAASPIKSDLMLSVSGEPSTMQHQITSGCVSTTSNEMEETLARRKYVDLAREWEEEVEENPVENTVKTFKVGLPRDFLSPHRASDSTSPTSRQAGTAGDICKINSPRTLGDSSKRTAFVLSLLYSPSTSGDSGKMNSPRTSGGSGKMNSPRTAGGSRNINSLLDPSSPSHLSSNSVSRPNVPAISINTQGIAALNMTSTPVREKGYVPLSGNGDSTIAKGKLLEQHSKPAKKRKLFSSTNDLMNETADVSREIDVQYFDVYSSKQKVMTKKKKGRPSKVVANSAVSVVTNDSQTNSLSSANMDVRRSLRKRKQICYLEQHGSESSGSDSDQNNCQTKADVYNIVGSDSSLVDGSEYRSQASCRQWGKRRVAKNQIFQDGDTVAFSSSHNSSTKGYSTVEKNTVLERRKKKKLTAPSSRETLRDLEPQDPFDISDFLDISRSSLAGADEGSQHLGSVSPEKALEHIDSANKKPANTHTSDTIPEDVKKFYVKMLSHVVGTVRNLTDCESTFFGGALKRNEEVAEQWSEVMNILETYKTDV